MSLNFLPRFPIDRWPFFPLPLIVGSGFMEQGFAKLAKGPDAFANILQAIGVPGRHFMALSTILVEILGGFAVMLGAFVTLPGSHVHCTSALRIQFDQAQRGDCSRRAVRSARL